MPATLAMWGALSALAGYSLPNNSTLATLKASVLSGMDPTSALMRPALRQATCGALPPPEQLEVQLYIDRFHDISQREQTYGMEGYLRRWWRDPELAYNGSCGAKRLSLTRAESAKIWRPQLYWEQSIRTTHPHEREHVEQGAGELLEIYPDGTVFWSQQVSLELSCQLDLKNVPFDVQSCNFMMGLYSDTAEDVMLSWKADRSALDGWDSRRVRCLNEFVVIGVEQQNLRRTYEHEYTYALATITFARQPHWLITNYLMPAVVLVAVSYLSFFIDPAQMNARVALGVLALVVVSNNYISLGQQLPNGSQTWLASFLLASFGFNVAAFVITVIVTFAIQIQRWLDVESQHIQANRTWLQVDPPDPDQRSHRSLRP